MQKMFIVTANNPSPSGRVPYHREAWVAAESMEALTAMGLQGRIEPLPYPFYDRYASFQMPQQALELSEFLAS